ncbi:sodium:alanine symporter family protein [Cutibacterium acnes JCM 18916]|nr:sodium:alanine symporter family protein [Cutibacterium acnes JCM 18916]
MPLDIMTSPVSANLEALVPTPLSLDQAIDNIVSPIATAISDAVFWLFHCPGEMSSRSFWLGYLEPDSSSPFTWASNSCVQHRSVTPAT